MTIGRERLMVSACSRQSACSTTSAFSLSRSTTARRTVHTLIGSYVALRTSTRPPADPRRWCSVGGADPGRSGGVATAISGRSVAATREAAGRRERLRGGVGAEDPHVLGVPAQALQGLGDGPLCVAALEVDEEEVPAEALLARPGLDLGQIDPAEGELRQAAHEPAGLLGADAPEDDRRLPRPVLGRRD